MGFYALHGAFTRNNSNPWASDLAQGATAGAKRFISLKNNVKTFSLHLTFNMTEKKKKNFFPFKPAAAGEKLPHQMKMKGCWCDGDGWRLWLPGTYVERAVDLEDRLDVQLLPQSGTMSPAQEYGIPPHHWQEDRTTLSFTNSFTYWRCFSLGKQS